MAIPKWPVQALGVVAMFDSDTGRSQKRPKREASRMVADS
jgi:hypothetical protein